jgi:hypothetical protein
MLRYSWTRTCVVATQAVAYATACVANTHKQTPLLMFWNSHYHTTTITWGMSSKIFRYLNFQNIALFWCDWVPVGEKRLKLECLRNRIKINLDIVLIIRFLHSIFFIRYFSFVTYQIHAKSLHFHSTYVITNLPKLSFPCFILC